MFKKNFKMLLFVEAMICLILTAVQFSNYKVSSAIMVFPFEQLSLLLRKLSLSGNSGNIVAIMLYFLISFSPCLLLFSTKRKRRLYIEDNLAVILSALLFVGIYLMINPGLLSNHLAGTTGVLIANAIIGVTIYSVICAYIVLRMLRLFLQSDMKYLQLYMKRLLIVVNICLIYLIFGAGIHGLIDSIVILREANIGNEHLLGTSYLFLVLGFLVDNIPFMFTIGIICVGIELLEHLVSGRYSQEAVIVARKLSTICQKTLIIIVLSSTVFNILQLIFINSLHKIIATVQIPLFEILFVLAILIFSRLICENKELKEESDSFI